MRTKSNQLFSLQEKNIAAYIRNDKQEKKQTNLCMVKQSSLFSLRCLLPPFDVTRRGGWTGGRECPWGPEQTPTDGRVVPHAQTEKTETFHTQI